MTSLRLTNSDVEGVVKRAMAHALTEREAGIKAAEHSLGMKAYEFAMPVEDRMWAKKLPEKWVRRDSCLRFHLDFRHVVLHVDPPVVVPSANYNCHSLATISDVEIIAAFEKLEGEKSTFKADRERMSASLYALVRRASTLKKLREMWPEGEQFYAHLKPREEAQVPAVQVEDVNRMLGLIAA